MPINKTYFISTKQDNLKALNYVKISISVCKKIGILATLKVNLKRVHRNETTFFVTVKPFFPLYFLCQNLWQQMAQTFKSVGLEVSKQKHLWVIKCFRSNNKLNTLILQFLLVVVNVEYSKAWNISGCFNQSLKFYFKSVHWNPCNF